MSNLNQLLARIEDTDLREAIQREFGRRSTVMPTVADVIEHRARTTTMTTQQAVWDVQDDLAAVQRAVQAQNGHAEDARFMADTMWGQRIGARMQARMESVASGLGITAGELDGLAAVATAPYEHTITIKELDQLFAGLDGPRATSIMIDETPPKPLTPLQRKRAAKARHNDAVQAISRRKRGWQ